MEIKRVIAGGLATLAAGATFALGAGAVTLGDFVTVSGNTMTSPYLVIGDNAAAADTLAAADIGVALAGQATQTVSIAGSLGTMSVTDGASIETKSRKLYYGENLNSASIKPKILSKDLPTILAGGTVNQKDGKDVDYSQYLTLGAQSVTFGRDSKWDDPALYIDLVKGETLYTYELIFSQGLDTGQIANKEIEMLGVPYVFSDTSGDLAGNKLVLYGAGQTETISAGQSTTVTIAGNDYVITVVGVGEGNDAVLDINGEQFDVDTDDSSTVDIEKDDLNLHVKAVRAVKFPTESGSVQVFIGSEKTTLHDVAGSTDEVQLGSTGVDGTVLTITNTTTKIDKISIVFSVEDKEKLQAGDSVTDPVFGAFKIAFGGIYPELDSATKDVVEIEKSGDDSVDVTWTNRDGIEYDMSMLYLNNSAGGLDVSDGSYNIKFYNNATIVEGDFLAVTTGTGDEKYSYILEFTDYTSDDEVILTDVSSGTEYTISSNTEYIYPGESGSAVKVTSFKPGGVEAIALNNTGTAVNDLVSLYTENGGKLIFEIGNATGDLGTTDPKTKFKGYINVTEHTFKTSDDVAESTIRITLSNDTSKVSNIVGGGDVSLVADDDNDYKYGVSSAGSYVIEDVENDIVTIYATDEPTPVYVGVGSNPMFSAAEGASGGSVEQAVQIKNSISKMESEVNTASLDRDLVLLGGPCANGLVAELLEMSSSNPDCATEFTALYPTEGVITVVSDAFSSGQKALVVAGVNRAMTRSLAVKVMQGTLDYEA
jgi:hypothetical protein